MTPFPYLVGFIRNVSFVLAVGCSSVAAQPAAESTLDPDSIQQAGVPEGKIEGPITWHSDLFPGTQRDYWLYIPAQYEASKPACVMVVQDGIKRAREWRLPTVMDNLIHARKMPTTIGIFIDPGVVQPPVEGAQPRFNRSFEYDALGDRYARFLLEEMLPEVSKRYSLSVDPNDRAIAGASSGGICAFTVAWERPDAFRRVLSTIGTYVALKGGDAYPALIRKVEQKPIRVFLEDGSGDLNIYGGDWWAANQSMLSALQYAKYDVHHAWGDGGHNGKHGRQVMAEAMRWLWRDYPKPITANLDSSNRRTQLLIPGEPWQVVSEGHKFTEGPAVTDSGELVFSDIPSGKIHHVDADGRVTEWVSDSPKVNGLMFGPNGQLYACQNGNRRIVRYDADGNEHVVLRDAPCNDLVVLPNGILYTDPGNHSVWFVSSQGKRTLLDDQLKFPNGIAVSPDRTRLFVSDSRARFVYDYQLRADGSVYFKQPWGHLHLPDDAQSGADGMTVDVEGRVYVATRVGLQVFDQLGRVHFIIAKPQAAPLSNVVFGGAKGDRLYVTCGDKVYRRKVATRGVPPWRTAVVPPKPGL